MVLNEVLLERERERKREREREKERERDREDVALSDGDLLLLKDVDKTSTDNDIFQRAKSNNIF
jgi:hypothetical protein